MTEHEIEIERYEPKSGYGVGVLPPPLKGRVEVAHAVVGDRLRVELKKLKYSVKKGRLLEVMRPSRDRVEPRCAHAGICGGCSLQQVAYEAQLRQKEVIVQEAFRSYLLEKGASLYPILPCAFPWGYRNKMEFSFSQNRAGTYYLGLMIAQASSFVFNVEACHLAAPWFSKTLCAVRAWWEKSGLAAYHPPADEGSLQTLVLREGVRTGQKMVILNVSGNPAYAIPRALLDSFVQEVRHAAADESTTVFLRIRQIAKGKPTQWYEMHLSGPDHIVEELHVNVKGEPRLFYFKISPTSFFQPNTLQAEKLYERALSKLTLTPETVVYDLYCGTGTLGMSVAPYVKKAVGIELNPHAVFDAQENAKRNNITNFALYAGDVGAILNDVVAKEGRPDILILDPPRAGLDATALRHVLALSPQTILYISCNPLTQAENVAQLTQAGYRLLELHPIDQFPHTMHIENIALLRKIS